MQKHKENLIFVLIFSLLSILVIRAFDEHVDNRDVMLCESARVSGNEIYLDRCICYYKGESIRCIYKGVN